MKLVKISLQILSIFKILHSSYWFFTFTYVFFFSIIGHNISALGTKIFKELWRSYNILVGNLDMLLPSWEDGIDWWTIWLKHSNHKIVMHLFLWEISLVVAIGIYLAILKLFISFALWYLKFTICPLIIRWLLLGAWMHLPPQNLNLHCKLIMVLAFYDDVVPISWNNLDHIMNYGIHKFALYHTLNQTLKAQCIWIFANLCSFTCIGL
jgi:hypothetical protein